MQKQNLFEMIYFYFLTLLSACSFGRSLVVLIFNFKSACIYLLNMIIVENL